MPYLEKKRESEPGIAKTVILTERDVQDAARLFRLLADPVRHKPGMPDIPETPFAPDALDRETLVSRARIVLGCRKLRDRYFNPVMFGEPAWDILLLLYISEYSASRPTLTTLSEWIDAPVTTVMRWVDFLEEERLAERQGQPAGGRNAHVGLLEKGRAGLESYLGTVPDEGRPATG